MEIFSNIFRGINTFLKVNIGRIGLYLQYSDDKFVKKEGGRHTVK